jgi:LysM repeat protein
VSRQTLIPILCGAVSPTKHQRLQKGSEADHRYRPFHVGDTLQTIATTDHVPLWALTQINKLSETVALTESQRIVIPHSIGQKLSSCPPQSPVASDATPTEH